MEKEESEKGCPDPTKSEEKNWQRERVYAEG